MEVGRALNKVQSAITGDVLEVWEESLFQHAGKLGGSSIGSAAPPGSCVC